ncbi:MAG: dihydrofolate reductase [Lachnospiraceae bacterium]|nr:dihydrofolate reductase [Lachnospiraceae bacterium]
MNCIVCVDRNWAIGKENQLLVNIPADKHFFRGLTTGGVVLGGRKTMEGLPDGVVLPDRVNIVLTRQLDYQYEDAVVVHSRAEALDVLRSYDDKHVFVIGGGVVYQTFLRYCDHVYVTKVGKSYEADTFFPNLDQKEEWEVVWQSEGQSYQEIPFTFYQYRRKNVRV